MTTKVYRPTYKRRIGVANVAKKSTNHVLTSSVLTGGAVGVALTTGVAIYEKADFNTPHTNHQIEVKTTKAVQPETKNKGEIIEHPVKVNKQVASDVEVKPHVQNSIVLSRVEIKQKEQTALLTSSNAFYVKKLPIESGQGGKAIVKEETRQALAPIVNHFAKKHGIESYKELVFSMIKQETGENEKYLSTDPMQVSRFAGKEVVDPIESIDLGTKRLAKMIEEVGVKGDLRVAIQSYNYGKSYAKQAKKFEIKDVMAFSKEKTKEENLSNDTWRGEYAYGDYTYAAKVLSNFDESNEWKTQIEGEIEEQAKPFESIQEEEVEKEITIVKQTTTNPIHPINIDPTKELIVIDPGHGGVDPGGLGKGITEAELVYQMSVKVKNTLESKGYQVVITREQDENVKNPVTGEEASDSTEGVNNRIQLLKKLNPSLVISLHANAAASNASGVETIITKHPDEKHHSEAFAEEMQRQVLGVFGQKDRGVMDSAESKRGGLGILDKTHLNIPIILMEVGFITNQNEANKLQNGNIQEEYAEAITKSVTTYFEKKAQQTNTETEVKAEDNQVRIKTKDGKVVKEAVEEYLVGVLSAEMPSKFEIEALKAQAVAARTNILKKLKTTKKKAYDVDQTVNLQAYLTEDERKARFGENLTNDGYKKIVKAVEETNGQVLTYEDQLITASFYASSNGHSEKASEVWNGNVPYLQAVKVNGEKELSKKLFGKDQTSHEIEMTITEFEKKLGIEVKKGDLGEPNAYTPGKRVKEYEISGKVLTGEEIREKLSLRSTDFLFSKKGDNVLIQTKGYGHGIGMSQLGAGVLADKGESYQEILDHFYPKTKLQKVK